MNKIIRVFVGTVLLLSVYSIGYANGGNNRLAGLSTAANSIFINIFGEGNSLFAYFAGTENGSMESSRIVQSVAAGDNGGVGKRFEFYHRKLDETGEEVCHMVAAIQFGADGEELEIKGSTTYPPDPILPEDALYPPDDFCVAEGDVGLPS